MSRWVDGFQGHSFNNVLSDFTNSVEELLLPKDIDESTAEEFARIKKVVAYINEVTNSIDPELISPIAIKDLNGNLQAAQNEFNTFIANKNFNHLQNTNKHLDNVLNNISRAFVFYKKPSKSKLKDIIKSYADILDEHRDNFQESAREQVNRLSRDSENALQEVKKHSTESLDEITDLRAKISKLDEEVTHLEQQAQAQLADFNKQFQNTQESNQTKFDNTITRMNAKFDQQTEKNQERLDAFHKNSQEKVDALHKATQEKIDNEFAILSTKAGTIVETLGKLQENAETVFGVVQNTVQAGAHKKYADQEKRTANRYRFGAISLMMLAVAVLILPEVVRFSDAEQTLSEFITNINWDSLLTRLPFSAILFAPAYYLARESSKHRQNEFQNRRRELTLRTIDPYLALIDDNNKREDLKCNIAQGIFGTNDFTVSQGSETVDVIAQLSNLTNNLSKTLPRK